MNNNPPKIKLTQLWQRKAKSGEIYLSGFLAGARIVILRDRWASEGDLQPGCEAIWVVFLQQAEDRQASQDYALTSLPSNGTAQSNSDRRNPRWAERSKVEESLDG